MQGTPSWWNMQVVAAVVLEGQPQVEAVAAEVGQLAPA